MLPTNFGRYFRNETHTRQIIDAIFTANVEQAVVAPTRLQFTGMIGMRYFTGETVWPVA